MLKGDILCKRGKQNTLLRKDIMPKSALFFFFAEIVFFFSERGVFFWFFFFFFWLKPAGRTVSVNYTFASATPENSWLSVFVTDTFCKLPLFCWKGLTFRSKPRYFGCQKSHRFVANSRRCLDQWRLLLPLSFNRNLRNNSKRCLLRVHLSKLIRYVCSSNVFILWLLLINLF